LRIPQFTGKGPVSCILIEDPEIFFPDDERMKPSEVAQATAAAKKICHSCNYISECLEYAVLNKEDGIWGGTTKQERRRIRARRRKSVGITNGAVRSRQPASQP
jgi:WhiB family redox-sensing transcriptional regulator